MKKLSLTKERLLAIYARIDETGVSRVLSFYNVDAAGVRTPHPINSLGYEIRVKKSPFATTNLFVLSVGAGLTVQGSDLNQLKIDLSNTKANQKPVENFYKLFSTVEDKTTLNGPWFFHDGEFDGVVETDEILIGATADVVIEIRTSSTNGNTDVHDWAGTTTLPSDVAAGYWIKFTSECIVPYLSGVRTYPAGSVAFSLVANSGSAANWYSFSQG